ncbi:MAG: hypothetical protein KDD36_05660 [Flavobacteriales bacterium]|nr:hypothetical protein [Flavobacteriales bacterium]
MERLKEVIGALGRADIIKIRTYYKNRNDSQHSKRLELFELVHRGKVCTDLDAAQMLYGGKPNSAFSHLKSRLLDDIMDVMLANISDGDMVEASRTACRKKMLLSEILVRKGIKTEGWRNLKTAAQLAWKNHLSTEQVMVLEFISEFFPGETLEQLIGEKDPHDLRQMAHLLVARQYLKTFVFNRAALYENLAMLSERKEVIRDLVNDLSGAMSSRPTAEIRYYLLSFSSCILRVEGEYQKALQQAIEVDNMDPESLSHSGRQNGSFNIALCYLYTGQWAEASARLQSLIYDEMKGEPVTEVWSELLFRTYLYARQYEEAEALTEKYLLNAVGQTEKGYRWMFYRSVIHYRKGHLQAALLGIQKATCMLDDRVYGADLGYRYTELILLIESRKWDLAQIRIDAFQQLLKRRDEPGTQRYRLIARALASIVRTAGIPDHREPHGRQITLLTFDGKSGNSLAWDPIAFELIPAGEWLEGHEHSLNRNKRLPVFG